MPTLAGQFSSCSRRFRFIIRAARRSAVAQAIALRPSLFPIDPKTNSATGYHHHLTRQVGIGAAKCVFGCGGGVELPPDNSLTSPAIFQSGNPSHHTCTFFASGNVPSVSSGAEGSEGLCSDQNPH